MNYLDRMNVISSNASSRTARYAIIDTETTNSYIDENGKLCLTDSFVYDIAVAIIDKYGRVYAVKNYICDEIFHSQLMLNAYFVNKIPEYVESINKGEMVVMPIMNIYYDLHKFLQKHDVKAIMAHNAKFDYRALNNTIRYLSGSRKRYFLPYDLPIWDTQRMAHDTICKQKSYIQYCKDNNYMTKHRVPQPRETAEILYRYITGDNNFLEEHKGYEDIMIEKEIFVQCVKQHKTMEKLADLQDC